MGDGKERMAVLFNRYFSGQATADEEKEFFHLVQEAKDDEQLALILKELWENFQESKAQFSPEVSNRIFNSIVGLEEVEFHEVLDEEDTIRPFPVFRYAAAAAILVMIGLAWWWKSSIQDQQRMFISPISKKHQITPTTAQLTLSDGSVINLDSVDSDFLVRQGLAEIRKEGGRKLIYKTLVGRGSMPLHPVQSNTLSTPKGGHYQVVLPDGSKAWVNTLSSISFPPFFAPDERRVRVNGEVYFEVVKASGKPFKVLFGNSEVEVLGTSFNIKAYPDEAVTRTTLLEGSIVLRNKRVTEYLKPGQQATLFPDGNVKTENVNLEEVTAWKDNLFYFRDANVEDVMQQISRWYDIKILYEGKDIKRQFTGKVSRNVALPELLSMLRYAGVNCHLKDSRTIIVTR